MCLFSFRKLFVTCNNINCAENKVITMHTMWQKWGHAVKSAIDRSRLTHAHHTSISSNDYTKADNFFVCYTWFLVSFSGPHPTSCYMHYIYNVGEPMLICHSWHHLCYSPPLVHTVSNWKCGQGAETKAGHFHNFTLRVFAKVIKLTELQILRCRFNLAKPTLQ